MAKKKTGGAVSQKGTTDDKPKEEPMKVTIDEPVAVKQALDFEAARYLIDVVGYPEDVHLSNLKLGIGVVGCLFATAAQFWPVPLPESWYLVAFCVACYFACSSILQLLMFVVESDCILLTLPHKDDASRAPLNLRAAYVRYETKYTLILRPRDQPLRKDDYSLDLTITDYFDTNGHFLKDEFHSSMEKFWKGYLEHEKTHGKSKTA